MSACTCCDSIEPQKNVACMVYAFDQDQRIRYHALKRELTSLFTAEELPDGYAFLFPNKPLALSKIAEWVALENLCCPFIQFTIRVSGESEEIRVELTGNDAVRDLIKQEFSL